MRSKNLPTLILVACVRVPYVWGGSRTIRSSNRGAYMTNNDDDTSNKPLKVFLLSGQSNMVGMGSVEHLKRLVDGTSDGDDCPCDYQTLWNGSDWTERDDVYMQYDQRRGKLRAGSFGGGADLWFGPEVGMGWVLGDVLNETIVFIKAAYGGRSLAIDFRPPSSGEGNYPKVKPSHYGWEYRQMVDDINTALANLQLIYPGYNKTAGYELSGFVWFQGWNDMLNWSTVLEYSYNLANFIRDVRTEFDAPDLPFVIGELGMAGLHPTGRGSDRVWAMRAAQRNVTEQDEFAATTAFVPTALYARPNLTSYNAGYHYNGRADTYFHIGKAFGRALLSFLNTTMSMFSDAPRQENAALASSFQDGSVPSRANTIGSTSFRSFDNVMVHTTNAQLSAIQLLARAALATLMSLLFILIVDQEL